MCVTVIAGKVSAAKWIPAAAQAVREDNSISMAAVFPVAISQQEILLQLKFPLKFLTSNSNTTIAGVSNQSSIFNCIVYRNTSNSPTPTPLGTLLYQIVPGATYTKQFYIPSRHQYLQFKFNAAIVETNQVILQYQLINANGITILSGRQSPTAPNDTNLFIQCQGNTTVSGVFYVNKALSTTQQNLTLQIKSLDGNAIFGISNIQIYYGSCNKKCQTCSGPTQNQCLTCQGLYMQLINGTCQTCPAGYYDSGTLCRLCPKNCQSCTFSNQTQQVTCTVCNKWASLSEGKCVTDFESYSLPEELRYNSTDSWVSSEVTFQPLTVCGQYSLIGGISIGRQASTISKTFNNLIVHSQVSIRMAVWMIDQQPDDKNFYQIFIDGVIVKQQEISISPQQSNWVLSNQCGSSNPEIQFIVTLNSIPHTRSNITISIRSFKNFFGLRDVTLVVNNKTNVVNCQTQSNGVCVSCQKGFKYNAQKKTCNECSEGYYLTRSKDSCQVCPIQCKSCQLDLGIQKIICLSCVFPLQLTGGLCKDVNGAIYGRDIIPNGIRPLKENRWKLYPKLPNRGISTCGNKSIIGSDEIRYKFLQMERQYNNLPSHRGIKVYFHFYQIDTFTNESVSFIVNGKTYLYKPTIQRKQICGDSNIPDAVVKLQFIDQGHTDSTFLFEVRAKGKIKLGINNFVVFLLNCDGCNNVVPFEIESIPMYSLTTPPVKGLQVKIMVDQTLRNQSAINSAIEYSITKPGQQIIPDQATARLLQGLIQFNEDLPILSQEIIANRQYRSFLQLSEDYIDSKITVDPVKFWALSTDPNSDGTNKLLSSTPVTQPMPRYIDIDENNVDNRSNIRNLRNLFQGCAILALWIGLASFILGFSGVFDDFFTLVQVIFVHIFIQLAYSPPSLRLPLQGMQIVQFMAWLPWQARVEIQKGIIAPTLYQRSPIVYQQYYKDIVFARTIYHTILFLVFMVVLYILLQVLTHMLISSPKSKRKYADNYAVKYYTDYKNNHFTYLEKFVRFAFFTVVWACTLQFTHFENSPKEFNIWNGVLCIFMFVIFVLYPIGGFFWLRKMSGEMSELTFRKKYQDVRINSNRLFFFIWRYYKLLVIALLIGLLYDANPLATLIPLIVLHILDGLIILLLNPLGMEQQQQLNVCLYNYYPTVYKITSAVQSFLFAFLELFILITYAVRDTATNYSYLGLGYFCCAIIIALLVNGLLRLIWGFIKLIEGCFAKSKEMKLLVENKAYKQKQSNEQLMPIKSIKQLQSNLNNLQTHSRMNTMRKTTLVSKIN